MSRSVETNDRSSLGDIRLRMQLLFVELALQIISAITIVSAVSRTSAKLPLVLIGSLVAVAIFRLIAQSKLKPSASGELEPGPLQITGSLANGIIWGAVVIAPELMLGKAELTSDVLNAVLIVVVMASFIGAALRPWPFSMFFLPVLAAPLYLAFMEFDMEQIAIWLLLLLASITLAIVANKHNVLLSRIRSVTRQNALLMKNLTDTRNQALQNQQLAERSNQDLIHEVEERKRVEEKIRESENELSEILKDLQDTYFRINLDGIIKRLSPSVKYMVGYLPEELIESSWKPLFVNLSDRGDFTHALEKSMGHLHNHELCLRHKDGSEVWISMNCHYYYDADKIAGFEGTARDITDKRKAEDAVFRQKERLSVTLASIGDGVVTTDLDGLVEYLNPKAEELTGWDLASAEGNPLSAIMNMVDENKGEHIELSVIDWMEEGKLVEFMEPAMLVHKDNNKQVAIELTAASIHDSLGMCVGAVMVFRDVTKIRSLTKQLAHQATHDALTGLPNRVEFENRVEQALRTAQSGKKKHAIFYIDLDQFKAVNDTAGHHAGDKLLQQLAQLMQDLLRSSDTLARLGGDEFGVLLPGCPLPMAEEIAEKLRAAVEEYRLVWEGDAFRVGLSIGVVPMQEETSNLTEILQSADSACYVAKERGRNCVHVFRPADIEVAEHRDKMQWMQRIQNALDNDLFLLHFQPIIETSGKKIRAGLHGEILVRMIDADTRDIIMPSSFIPTAERYHLMPKIDKWVIKNSLEAISKNETAGVSLDLCSINLSGQSMGDMAMVDFILEQIKISGVSPHKLCFEITESAVISNLEYARQFIIKLKDIGCSFALDDFGSGLSSFDYLKNLPVDYVKLDGSLIRDVATNKVSQAMVHAINYVSHVMNMKSIAEYVEDDAILHQLQRISIDYVQGYEIGRPGLFDSGTLKLLEAKSS